MATAKVGPKGKKVMHEFGQRTLKSSSGETVTNPKQAFAIAMSEQRAAKKSNARRGRRRSGSARPNRVRNVKGG